MKLGVDWIYRIIFTHSYFYATGGDRGYAFKSRPEEVYNDYMYDNKDYKAVMEELRDFLLQENSITSAVLVASYAVAKDNSCVMSRTKYGDCFCIDPVLTGPFNSPMHKLLQDKIEQIALRTNARPHLNKVTNLSSANIKAAYKQEDLQAYINWCNKQDSKGLFQGKFYRLLTEALS